MNRIAGFVLATLAAGVVLTAPIAAAAAPAPTGHGAPPADRDADTARLAQALFQEGVHYERLPTTQPTTSSAGTVEVAEFFMYSCPHCFNFEPHVTKWLEQKPSDVSFVRIPASFNRVAELHARAFYAAQALGVLDDVHEDFFREFHVKRNRLTTESAVADFFVSHGVERKAFEKAMASFPVDAKLKKATTMAQRYRVQSVPSVYVNGKYRTDASMAGNYPRLLEVIDYLIGMEKAANRSASASGN
jgi:thiol:disulfide interchange protein DsbA